MDMKKHKGFIFLILLNLLPVILIFLFFFFIFLQVDFISLIGYIVIYPYIFYITMKLYIIDTIILVLYFLYNSLMKNRDKNKRVIFGQVIAIIVMIALDFFTYDFYNMLMLV